MSMSATAKTGGEPAGSTRVEAETEARRWDALADLAHDLRTPLTIVIGLADLMKAQADFPQHHREHLELLAARATDILGMVELIFDLHRLDSEGLAPRFESVDVAALLEDMVESARALLAGRPVDLRLEVVSLPPSFPTDPSFLRRIVANLLSNATKFTEAGTVTVSAGGNERGISLRVRDTGPGLKPDELPRLFKRFTRLEAKPHRRRGGTGLGLAIVKGLAERLGGSVAAESQEGAGACFTVRLPVPLPVVERVPGPPPPWHAME